MAVLTTSAVRLFNTINWCHMKKYLPPDQLGISNLRLAVKVG